jgi:hypothetical protein
VKTYAGKAWAIPLGGNADAHNVLPAIARDLASDAADNDVRATNLELWERQGFKGLFTGDTSSLANEGWTFVVELL